MAIPPVKPLTYRPEIDGLRALAVLAVVIFHAGFTLAGKPFLAGGFIGVDIFFVISGYLITSIILRELSAGNFSLAHFYERRARRILPALFTVLAASLPFAWKLMLPKAMQEYAGANLSSLFFGSNFWFWREDSYFAEPAALKPFLHTWSLSVEEQFYVFFPLLLMGIWAVFRKRILLMIIALALLSLLAAHMVSGSAPDTGFYLLPFRGWELLAGALLAKVELKRGRPASKGAAKTLPALGLIMIVGSFIMFGDNTPHPSLLTAFPVIGTMLLIRFSSPNEPLTRLLSTKPFVAIGLISYSLYLWHFTLFAFARIWQGGRISTTLTLALIGTAFILSIITYFLVEKPARNKNLMPRKIFIPMIGLFFASLVGTNALLYTSGGAPARLGSVADLISETKRSLLQQDGKNCIGRKVENACYFPAPGAAQTIILIGDSHAEAISRQLLQAAESNGVNLRLFLEGGCPLIPETFRTIHKPDKRAKCLQSSKDIQEFLETEPTATIIYFSFMAHYLGHDEFQAQDGNIIPARSASITTDENIQNEDPNVATQARLMFETWINARHKLFVIGPVPEARVDVPKTIRAKFDENEFTSPKKLQEIDLSSDIRDHENMTKRVSDLYGSLGRIQRLEPTDVFCMEANQLCLTHDDKIFYADSNHLSPYGAEKLVAGISKELGWK